MLEDKDASMFVDVARTKDWRFITLNVNTKTTSEAGIHFLFLPRVNNNHHYLGK